MAEGEIRLDLGLDEKTVRNLAADAILRAIDGEARERLIGGALKYLLSPQGGGTFGRPGLSPLEDAFRDAIARLAEKMVRERLEGDPSIQAEVLKLIGEAWAKLLSPERREAVVGKVAEAIGRALLPREY